MLKSIVAVLEELDLLCGRRAPHHYVNITAGDCMAVSLFLDDRRFVHVKVSEYLDLSSELGRCKAAWQRFPGFVPRPLGHGARNGWSVLVSEGIWHTPLQPAALLRPSAKVSPIIEDLYRYFAAACNEDHLQYGTACDFAPVANAFTGTEHAALAERWLEYGHRCGVYALPKCSQHGDFVLNNLGWTGSQLVIFDWEDFDKIRVPGMDLATFLFSILGDDVELLRSIMLRNSRASGALDEFLRNGCARCRIDFEQFRMLIPVYLLLFFYLKRDYGLQIRERISAVLERLSS